MKTITRSLVAGVSGLFLLAYQLGAQAAPLNSSIEFGDPTLTTDGTSINYDFVSGVGGTLTIGGSLVTTFIKHPIGADSVVSGVDAPGSITSAGSDYLLTAYFDSAGNFVPSGSTVSVVGYSVNYGVGFGASPTSDPLFAGILGGPTGTILTMDLMEFGFTGGQAGSGDRDDVKFEWTADIVGGDFYEIGIQGLAGGVIASGFVTHTSDPSGSFGAGGWEDAGLGDTTAFLSDFSSCSGCAVQLNTYVPVPAAIWLFGSGLLALAGISRRRQVA